MVAIRSALWLACFHNQRVRDLGSRLPFCRGDARIEGRGKVSLGNWLAKGDVLKTGLACDLGHVRRGQDRKVLSATKDEIRELAADTVALVRKVTEPRGVILLKFLDRAIAVRTADPDDSAMS